MQKAWRDDPKHLDVEGAQYHYPSRYLGFINGFERFVYCRPSKGAPRGESSKYVGYGEGEWFADPNSPTHRFVNVRKYRAFSSPVSYASAKSVVDVRASVDRMRYGLGQLLDYGVRYRSELEGAKPILAFGQIPNRENSWISTILNENGVASVGMRDADTVVALNTRAEAPPLFA